VLELDEEIEEEDHDDEDRDRTSADEMDSSRDLNGIACQSRLASKVAPSGAVALVPVTPGTPASSRSVKEL
jgi:hypothetical protein